MFHLPKSLQRERLNKRLFSVLKVVLYTVVVISEVLLLSTKSRCSRCCMAYLYFKHRDHSTSVGILVILLGVAMGASDVERLHSLATRWWAQD